LLERVVNKITPKEKKVEHSLKEMIRRAYQPIIKASLSPVGPLYVELEIVNVGNGAATNVELTFSSKPGKFKSAWYHPLLVAGQSECLMLPEGNLEKLAKESDVIELKGKYQDVFGETYKIDEKLDIKKIQKGWHKGRMVLKKTLEDRVVDLTRHVERIERTLGRMIALTSGVLVKTPRDIEAEVEEFKKRREERKKESGSKGAS